MSYEIVYGGPKTAHGKRRIALDQETIRALTGHEPAQRQELQLIGDNYVDQGLVFTREDGRPVNPDYFSQTFDRSGQAPQAAQDPTA